MIAYGLHIGTRVEMSTLRETNNAQFFSEPGSIHNLSIQKDDIEELRTRLLTMPAHPDVPAGLKQLKDAGFRLVSLTNSPPDPQTSATT